MTGLRERRFPEDAVVACGTLEQLLSLVVARPEDAATSWLIVADALEERGDPRGELVRLRHDLRYRPEMRPAFREARVQELLAAGVRPCAPRLVNAVGMEFVWIPAGTFWMGAPGRKDRHGGAERPRHEVDLTRPFYLAKFPVTQREYATVTGTNPSFFARGGAFPVENVSWEEATEFCARLTATGGRGTYRLPTEAEWEYACRAGSTVHQHFHFGDRAASASANFDGGPTGPLLVRTEEVGKYAPNAWGLHDMHGNVWEWCADWYHEMYYQACLEQNERANPRGPEGGTARVLRGGAWGEPAWNCRSAARDGRRADDRSNRRGFRVCFCPE